MYGPLKMTERKQQEEEGAEHAESRFRQFLLKAHSRGLRRDSLGVEV